LKSKIESKEVRKQFQITKKDSRRSKKKGRVKLVTFKSQTIPANQYRRDVMVARSKCSKIESFYPLYRLQTPEGRAMVGYRKSVDSGKIKATNRHN